MRIGFIGLGKMGAPMARNLLAHYPVTVYDQLATAIDELEAVGATRAESAPDTIRGSDVVFTMLPGPAEIESVMIDEGAADAFVDETLWIDMSSSSLEALNRVTRSNDTAKWSVLDAPVTGGVPGAVAGELQVFVGGDVSTYERALPILQVLANPDKILHVGEQGAGYTVKLCINLGFFLHAFAGAEVLALGTKAGVDLQTLHQALTGSGASSAFLENDMPTNIFAGDYKEYLRLALALKDLRLAIDLGRDVGVPLELSALVEQIHHRALESYGDGGQLLAVKQLEETTGISFRRRD